MYQWLWLLFTIYSGWWRVTIKLRGAERRGEMDRWIDREDLTLNTDRYVTDSGYRNREFDIDRNKDRKTLTETLVA